MTRAILALSLAALPVLSSAEAPPRFVSAAERAAALQRAQVWRSTDVASMDVRGGPPGGFAPHADVACEYVAPQKKLTGRSPKFECRLATGEVVKVKYGEDNGEVFAEVAATRLFWALGFGADAVYQVRLTCTGCPADPWKKGEPRLPSAVFEHAAIERKMPGRPIQREATDGWKWSELDQVDEAQGGAPRSHRDALRLLAAFVQHGDTRIDNQRLVCLDEESPGPCLHPFLLVHDLGSTFGRSAHLLFGGGAKGNFAHWSGKKLWKDPEKCEASLSSNIRGGNLNDPDVSEAGRRFLADLMKQLSDQQIRDLFDVSSLDARHVGGGPQRNGTQDEWFAAFVDKRNQLYSATCPR
jgi:hypothetical protein